MRSFAPKGRVPNTAGAAFWLEQAVKADAAKSPAAALVVVARNCRLEMGLFAADICFLLKHDYNGQQNNPAKQSLLLESLKFP
jgi:hypothetical protein